jgi:hypothetical protein
VWIGSAGGSEKRTSFTVEVTLAIPFSRWGAQPYITHPFLFPIANTDAVRAPFSEPSVAEEEVRHPIRLALEWQQMLADNPGLNMAGIAHIKGVSRARVTQVMNLLRLPKPLQTVLLGVTMLEQIRLLSERKLRPIMACSDARVKQQLVQQLLASVAR